jgi:uracil-DNA glycosylase family 4
MSRGFFPASAVLKPTATPSLLPRCGVCGLSKTCKSPKMPVYGEGRKGVLVIGEAPGANEDERGRPFVGKAGDLLRTTLKAIGVDFDKDCWVTNALICRPPDNKISDPKAIEYCRPNVMRAIRELKPKVIILLGASAVKSVIGEIWKESVGELSRWVGWNIPCQKLNAWICPTYHPSYLLREHNEVLDIFFAAHLEKAFAHEARPWETVPDWEKDVEVVIDTNKAAEILRVFTRRGGQLAFDYEATSLKPEYEGAEVICASVCLQGQRTIAYPWHGEAISATKELLWNDNCHFIASNMKYENRFTKFLFGKGVRHWVWDTMLAAHCLDNREGITGLKFQAFALLGVPSYDDHIKQFLQGVKDKKTNLAKSEIDLRQLLHYCAMDALLEYKVAKRQDKMFRK